MLDSFTFWLIVLGVLITYLILSVGLRFRAEEKARQEHEKQFPGQAFDASAIAPHIQEVRENYCPATRSRSRYTHHKAELLATARQTIAKVSFFRNEPHESEVHTGDKS